MSCLRHNHNTQGRHAEDEKLDIHGPRAVAIPVSSSDIRVGTRRSTSRSSSHSSSNSTLPRRPMSIPNRQVEDAPPPLPPPRYIQDLEDGHDIVHERENTQNKSGDLPPIREGSSLLGGFSRPSKHQDYARHSIGTDDDDNNERRTSTTTTVSPATMKSAMGNLIPSVVRRPPSPSATNPMLHGERPLAQQNLNRSNQLYDRDILSKIGKANSPPCHLRADSADSPVMAQKLSLQTKDMKPHQQTSPNETVSTADPSGRLVTSPMSNGTSPFSRQNWRDCNTGPQSPSLDHGAGTMALDPELFVSKHLLPISASGSLGAPDDTSNRSARSSYDQAMYTPTSEVAIEDAVGMRTLKPEEQLMERQSMRQGVKRKSPPSEGNADERTRPDLCPRLTTSVNARSPVTNYASKHGSLSSIASSVQQGSFAPSNFSAAPSSLTSASSYDTQSPKDLAHNSPHTMSTNSTIAPVTVIPSRKVVERIVPQKLSNHTSPPEIRPAPARIGNHYICACCPKKPKKFETEEQLRTHENEKQYSCNFCHNRFKNKNEAERHQNSLHLRKHSWSCSALDNYEAAFSPSGAVDSTSSSTDACGYCGEEFPNHPAPDWNHRIDHLTNVHKFGECNSVKKFFRADHFRQHLKHSHAGKSGKWTNILEHACVRDEMAGDGGGFSISTGENHQTPVTRPGTLMPNTISAATPVGAVTINSTDQQHEGT